MPNVIFLSLSLSLSLSLKRVLWCYRSRGGVKGLRKEKKMKIKWNERRRKLQVRKKKLQGSNTEKNPESFWGLSTFETSCLCKYVLFGYFFSPLCFLTKVWFSRQEYLQQPERFAASFCRFFFFFFLGFSLFLERRVQRIHSVWGFLKGKEEEKEK